MSAFDNTLQEIVANKMNHEKGYFNCIPFEGLERLEHYIPGVEMDTYYLLTASSGVGKSKLARSLFIYNPCQYLADNPDTDIKVSIIYFSLEESKKKIILSQIAKYLYNKYKIIVSIKQLQSRGRHNTIPADTIKKIEEAREYVEKFLEIVDIVDNIRNPTGIYKYVRDYAMEVGNYYDKNNVPFTDQMKRNVTLGKGDDYKKIAYYKKNHPRHFVIVLTDHISLLEGESGMNTYETMGKWSSDYCLRLRDKFGFTPVNVQQQASAKEQVQYNYKGKSIEEKLEPSLDGLGDNKSTQRDANIVMGLFAPDRYKIEMHNGYDIKFLRDRYRQLSILKDRDGEANKKVPLFFNGAIDLFRELPKLDNPQGMRGLKEHIIELNKNK